MKNKRPIIYNFLSHVSLEENGCWNWIGAYSRGYGRFNRGNKKSISAHRWSYEYFRGPISESLVIDHLCRNTICVNPEHLEMVTPRENVMRGLMANGGKVKSRTHCIRGHAFGTDNFYMVGGYRNCKICRKIYIKEYRLKHPEHRINEAMFRDFMKANGWYLIESAPKDKELVLYCPASPDCDSEGHNEFITVGCWGKHNHVPLYGWVRWERIGDEEVSEIHPTHWQPLPEPPILEH